MLFLLKCLAVSLAAFSLLLLLNYRYLQVMEEPYSDADKFHYLTSSDSKIQLCNIGSSHGEYAFRYDSLEEKYECFNFAMSSQTYNYDYAILSMYQKHFSDSCLMFIPVSYFSFNNEVVDEKEKQFLSAKYYTFLSPRYIPSYDPYIDLVTNRLPILSAGEDIIKLLPSLSIKAHAAEAEPSFQEKARNRYHRHMDNKENYFLPERIDNLYDILAFCEDNHITPVLITTPYTGLYSNLFSWEFKEEFYQTINAISQKSGVPYYEEGSSYFMEIIEKEIPEFREFLQK